MKRHGRFYEEHQECFRVWDEFEKVGPWKLYHDPTPA